MRFKKSILACALAVLCLVAGHASERQAWTYTAYQRAMEQSGRKPGTLDESTFLAAQQRKQRVLDQIKAMLIHDFGSADPAILKAFEEVPREYYMYDYEADRNLGKSAYEQPAREWKIGYGSVLTDYVMQAYMTAKCRPRPTDVSLEVGTGQRIPELAPFADRQARLYNRDHHVPGREGQEHFLPPGLR